MIKMEGEKYFMGSIAQGTNERVEQKPTPTEE